jgi:hypothetical protein
MAAGSKKSKEDRPEKSEAEIMRDMNQTLKRMHKMPPKPHALGKVGKAAPKPRKPVK